MVLEIRCCDRFGASGLLRQPIQHIVGDWDFVGITLAMQKGVLCPRPETEQLVMLCMDVINASGEDIPSPRILDVGCGTGAIGLALLDLLPYAECDVIFSFLFSFFFSFARTCTRPKKNLQKDIKRYYRHAAHQAPVRHAPRRQFRVPIAC